MKKSTKNTVGRAGLILTVVLAFSVLSVGVRLRSAYAALGDLVSTVTFSQGCASGIGVGIAYDGANLWYSCDASSTDLYRANPNTGQVTASYNIAGGLGALAYDASRNAIWAGWGGSNTGNVYLIQLDAAKNVVSSQVRFNTGDHAIVCGLDDGLAYDGTNDTLYISDDCSTTIHHYDTNGNHLSDGPNGTGDFTWAGSGCYNSGLAIGGNLLYEGSNGCNEVWVVDKFNPSAVVFNFSTSVPGDPNFRDEDLECDTNTFAAQGKHVMWSKEAHSPMRAHAFEIQFGSCGIGGEPDSTPPLCFLSARSSSSIRVTTQDTGSGLASITVLLASNATVSVPPFTVGTTGPVIVTATKIHLTESAQVSLQVTDVAGNNTNCDPLLTTVVNQAGKPVHHTFTGIPAEHTVTVSNGNPGLQRLDIVVNGTTFKVTGLHDDEELTLDVSTAMGAKDNTITLTGYGQPGAFADVLVGE